MKINTGNGELPGVPLEFEPKDNSQTGNGKTAVLPDLEKLLDRVLELLQYINTEEMKDLESKDPAAFETHLDLKFEDISMKYYSVFRLVIDKENREENIFRLIEIFSTLKKVKAGDLDIDRADEDFRENMNQEFIYSKYGGKEKFEAEMHKKSKKR